MVHGAAHVKVRGQDKLRVAFFYPEFCINRPIDPSSIWTSSRGLTGSELACVMYAVGLVKLGHGVTLFTKVTKPGESDGVVFCPEHEWDSIYRSQGWDAMCSFMTPEALRRPAEGVFRLFNQQVSDFTMCGVDWENHVDIVAPLSSSHAKYLVGMSSMPRDRWRVMHNGVDLSKFKPAQKERGKMIWASSHDRGLHWLLEMFPKIRQRVPFATLHIFYDFTGVEGYAALPEVGRVPTERELGRRARYTKEALSRLEGKGVFVHKSVSRQRMIEEMGSAEVLAYPCDPVHYTETFGVTVLEACASGAVPVLCTSDAFGELWGSVAPHVPPPFPVHKQEYLDILCRTLLDSDLTAASSTRCVAHASNFRWEDLWLNLEDLLWTRGKSGFPMVAW